MWNSAKAWDYVSHDPFSGLVLPEWDVPEHVCFSPEQVRAHHRRGTSTLRHVFWLVAQTGIRRGEVCALDVGHVDLAARVIVVRRSRNGRYITETKVASRGSSASRLDSRNGEIVGGWPQT